MNKDSPVIIYLQWEEYDGEFGVTWCEDQQYESDIEYVRSDSMSPKIMKLEVENRKLKEQSERFLKACKTVKWHLAHIRLVGTEKESEHLSSADEILLAAINGRIENEKT